MRDRLKPLGWAFLRFSESILVLLMILAPIVAGFAGYAYLHGLQIGVQLLRPEDLSLTAADFSSPATQLAARTVWETAATVQLALCLLAILIGIYVLAQSLRTDVMSLRLIVVLAVLFVSFRPLLKVWTQPETVMPLYANQHLIFQKTLGSFQSYRDAAVEKRRKQAATKNAAPPRATRSGPEIGNPEEALRVSGAKMERIRENLKLLKPGDPLYRTYVRKMKETEAAMDAAERVRTRLAAEKTERSAELKRAEQILNGNILNDASTGAAINANARRLTLWAIGFDWLSLCMAVYFAFVSSLLLAFPRTYFSDLREAEEQGYVNRIKTLTEKSLTFYETQLQLLRYVLYTGTFVLIFSLFQQSAMLNWAVASVSPDKKETVEQIRAVTTNFVTTRALISTLILAFVYLPSALLLQSRIHSLAARLETDPAKREVWLKSRGFAASGLEFLPRLAAILGPLLTVPANEVLRSLLTLNAS